MEGFRSTVNQQLSNLSDKFLKLEATYEMVKKTAEKANDERQSRYSKSVRVVFSEQKTQTEKTIKQIGPLSKLSRYVHVRLNRCDEEESERV
jgi:hypothetical protein